MRHLKVTDSDIIESVGFEEQAILKAGTIGAMEIVFKSTPDVVYRYENVNALLFVNMICAESIGKQFHESFKKTKFPFTKSERKQTLKK